MCAMGISGGGGGAGGWAERRVAAPGIAQTRRPVATLAHTSGVGCGWLINFDLAEDDYATRSSVLPSGLGATLRQFALKMVDPGGAQVRGAHAAAIDFGLRKNEPTVGGGGREVFTRLVGFFHGFSQFDELRSLLDGYFVSGFACVLEGLQVGLMLFQSPQNLHFVTCEQVKLMGLLQESTRGGEGCIGFRMSGLHLVDMVAVPV